MGSLATVPVLDRILRWRRPVIVLAHALLVALAYWLAFVLRFEFRLLPDEWSKWSQTLPFVLVVRLLVFQWFHLYVGRSEERRVGEGGRGRCGARCGVERSARVEDGRESA